jgi:hypothetical protein
MLARAQQSCAVQCIFNPFSRGAAVFIFSVPDMAVTDSGISIVKAVLSVDECATVFISMVRRGVEVTASKAGAAELSDAISSAGFSPLLLERGYAIRRSHVVPPKIPFDGADHDFTPGPLSPTH